jgi:hypothetical protein
MSDEPTYPKEAVVGAGASEQHANEPSTHQSGADAEGDGRRKKYVKAGVAVGIGSAAIVAALLYANRGKKHDRGNG